MEECIKKSFTSHSFLLLAHYATFAYQDMLFDYLTYEKKAKLVIKFNLPLPELPFLKTIEITESSYGKKGSTKKIFSFVNPPLIAYFLQSVQLFFMVLTSPKSYDIVITQDTLLAFISIILRFFGKCKTVIFYSHGIDRKRFKNKFFNILYQLLEKFSSQNSNFNWFLNNDLRELRKSYGIEENRLFWVPASIATNTVARKSLLFNHKIVFLGILSNKNGAGLLPKIMAILKKDIPDATLDIIGEGELSKKLRAEVKKLHLENHISFLGLLQFKDFSQILTNYSVGLAPYEDDLETLNSTSDSMKMRIYLAAGLPVIITRGVSSSEVMVEEKLGYAVDFTPESFANATYKLLKNRELNLSIRKKALVYSRRFDITNIYNKTFNKIFILLKSSPS